jgi:uncharacterized protein
MNLRNEYERLLNIVAERTPTAIAFSGGADSSLLLKAAVDVFGNKTLAFFASSILQTLDDIDNAIDTAERLGGELQIIEVLPLDWPQFTANPADRCYHCKKKIYSIFLELLPDVTMALADGSNLDDLSQKRPGHKAIEELGVLRPLVQAGLDKAMIRRLGKYLGVPSWDRESASCLATRIPSGLRITAPRLQDIAGYEKILHNLGFSGCRVRIAADSSRSVKIEIKAVDLPIITRAGVRKKLHAEFSSRGVDNSSLDLTFRP